ncbi:uncharacterized protein LOC117642382 [Thrips palmi]|uniref:Uncharacterized protein LOC117642382 n=1 Tax=Thrips palmi TaxID=161013 RepID=A0A6P8ZK27_THRPL|nr:uncharacterized protein LOC117642382 [Thrips palmi]
MKGVKGFSVLSEIPNFDIVTQLDPDSFHCLVNVAKRFTWLWFGKRFSGKVFSICDKLSEADARLLSITPTSDTSRFPRSLTERSDWRGHEWYHWILTYSIPCLKNLLPTRYFNHWSQLPTGLAYLMQNSSAKSDVGYGDRFLVKFVSEIDYLYGPEHVTFSIHLLTHLAKSVSDFAQPFCHSAYIYEAENAEIKSLVKSGNGAIFQIAKGVQLKAAVKQMEYDLKDNMTPNENAYLRKMTISVVHPVSYCTIGNASLLGNPDIKMLEHEAVVAFRRAQIQLDATRSHAVYLRCLLNEELLFSTKYTKAPKQNNSVVMLEDESIFIIDSFVVLMDKCFALGYYIMENKRQKICDPMPPHMKLLKNNHEGTLRCIPVSHIESKLLSTLVKISDDESLRLAYINVLSMEMLK